MASSSDDFVEFTEEHSDTIRGNLNLNDDLLATFKTKRFIEDLEYNVMKSKIEYERNRMFLEILWSRPGDYMRPEKIEKLIEILGLKKHVRRDVQDVFIAWQKRHVDFSGTTGSSSAVAEGQANDHLQSLPRISYTALGMSSEVPCSKSNDKRPTAPSGVPDSERVFHASDSGTIVYAQNITQLVLNKNQTWNNINNNYIGSTILNGNLEWIVDGNKVSSYDDIGKLFAQFAAEEQSGTASTLKNGQFLYLNWRYDGDNPSKIYTSSKLESAIVDEPKVTNFFQHMTNCSGKDYVFKRNAKKKELEKLIESFKNQIKPDTDYIVVILNAHGCNRTQLITDDLEAVDLFDDIVWKLDYDQFKGLAQEKPRLYIVNACQGFDKDYAEAAVKNKNPGDFEGCLSPYFVFCSTLPDELAWAHKKNGTVFFQAIYNGGFSKNVTMYNMIAKVQQKVDELAGNFGKVQTTSIMQSSRFKTNGFMFTAAK